MSVHHKHMASGMYSKKIRSNLASLFFQFYVPYLRHIKNQLTDRFCKDLVQYHDVILPPKRYRLCGPAFRSNEYFFASAQKEAQRLVNFCGFTPRTSVLDLGCGSGRLPIGLLSIVGEIENYNGVDVDFRCIQWCKRNIARQHIGFRFIHMDIMNARYNPTGAKMSSDFRFPFRDHLFDIIYLYSVFSHMIKEDVEIYLREFQRLLSPTGMIFLTGFFEQEVPDISINPDNYKVNARRTLQVVRYSESYFKELLDIDGFYISNFEYATETDGQSAVYIRKI